MKKILSLITALALFSQPAVAQTLGAGGSSSGGGGSTTISAPLGSQPAATSVGVALAAPNIVWSTAQTRSSNTTAYAAGQIVTTSSAAAAFALAIAPANGVPVWLLKTYIKTQTSGGAGVALTYGVFRIHIYGQAPTIANNDNGTFSTTMTYQCGTMECTLTDQGTDYSVAECYPTYGSAVACAPASGSQNIYGLIEARAQFTPTNAETFNIGAAAQ